MKEVYELPEGREVVSDPVVAAETWAEYARASDERGRILDANLEAAINLLKGHVLWSGRYVDEKMLYDQTVSFIEQYESGKNG